MEGLLCFLLLLLGSCHGATYSGYLTVNTTIDANLFYYFVESSSAPATDPVVLWLNGGPGCSSLFGAFVENGPQLIQKDGTLRNNPYSWTKKANVIWIDSPVGTGFSWVNHDDYATDEITIANDLYNGLQLFLFNYFGNYSKNNFYIFGESYAGKYIPWLSHTILTKNVNAKNKINLKGIGIGDGWVHPYYQTGSYGPYLYRNNRIGIAGLESANVAYEIYKALMDIGAYTAATVAGNDLLNALMLDAGVGDPYDIRKASDPTDPLQDALTKYLNLPTTRQRLGVGNHKWQACAFDPYYYLLSDEERSAASFVPDIISKVPVLIYNGDQDLICNMDGTDTWIQHMQWSGLNDFNQAKNTSWVVGGKPAGYYKTYKGFTQLTVYQAGHMVPYDQPVNAQDMLYRFISGGFN